MKKIICLLILGLMPVCAHAQEATPEPESPWILAPTVSSDPKLGTSLGLVGGYLYSFDAESTQSMFMAGGNYSDNDSRVLGVFGQMFFDRDQQKLIFGAADGKINNEYDDFLGTGLPAKTTDQLHAIFARYSHVFSPDWYAGIQLVSTDYVIGADGFLDYILDFIGLTGFDSTGLGLVAEYDTRNNVRNPTEGRKFEIHNIAYREKLGGNNDFDVYQLKFSSYNKFKKGHVLAWELKGRWTDDAPIGGYSSINLRGYVRGNYLAPHYTHFQIEDRISFNSKWGMSIFGGFGCLYDRFSDCESSANTYPAIGAGLTYTLKQKAGIVLRTEFAKGESDEYAWYVKLGNPF